MQKKIYKNKVSGYPVSYAQRRMWFLRRLETDKLLNNSTIKAELYGEIDPVVLNKAFQALINRHEAFRTNFFQLNDGQIIQVVQASRQAGLSFYDLLNLSVTEKRQKLQEIKKNNYGKIFELSSDCLIRFDLVRLKEKKFLCLVTLHHIISDAWTLAYLWDELSHLYGRFVLGLSSNLPQLSVQYRDYAAWERSDDYLEIFDKQRKYWEKKLQAAPPYTPLPLDYLRPIVQTYRHRLIKMEFSQKERVKIEKVCAELSVTPYVFFLSAYFLLLREISGADDIVVGTYVANRDQAEMERVAGIFLNNVAVRMVTRASLKVSDLIAELNQASLEAMNNKEYPFEKLLEVLAVKREAAFPPVFNTIFQLFNQDINLLHKTFSNCRKKVDFFNSNFFQHDLILRIGIEEEKIGFDLNYNTDLFSHKSIERFATAYRRIVLNICGGLNKTLNDFSFFSNKEKKTFKLKISNNLITPGLIEKNNADSQSDEIELEIIKTWRLVLGLEKITSNDSFFQLGGHSLKLIQVYDRLNKLFPGRLTVADLFQYYTVNSLANHLRGKEIKNSFNDKISKRRKYSQIIMNVKSGELSIDDAIMELNAN